MERCVWLCYETPSFRYPTSPSLCTFPYIINWYAKAVGNDEVYHDNTQGVVDYLRSLVISARIGRDSIMALWLCRLLVVYPNAKVERTTQYIRFQYARRH